MKNIIFQKVAKLINFCKNCMKFNKNCLIFIKISCFFHFFCLFFTFSFFSFLFLRAEAVCGRLDAVALALCGSTPAVACCKKVQKSAEKVHFWITKIAKNLLKNNIFKKKSNFFQFLKNMIFNFYKNYFMKNCIFQKVEK